MSAASFAAAEDAPTVEKNPTPPQALQKFPVQAESFSEIEEDYTNEDGAMKIEKFALLEIVAALKASTPEHLNANIDKDANFRNLMVHPEKFRGHVVQFDATFRFIYQLPIRDEDLTGSPLTLYHGQLSSRGNLISFASLQPLPDGLQPGQTVRFTGIFMKRFAYLNKRKPGVELTWTPLIIIQKLEPYKEPEAPQTSEEMFLGYIAFILIAAVIFFIKSRRNTHAVARSNPFTKIKNSRDGPPTLFPKSRNDKK